MVVLVGFRGSPVPLSLLLAVCTGCRGDGFLACFVLSICAVSGLVSCDGVVWVCCGCSCALSAGCAPEASGVGEGEGEGAAAAGGCCGTTSTGFLCVQPERIPSTKQRAGIVMFRRSGFMLY